VVAVLVGDKDQTDVLRIAPTARPSSSASGVAELGRHRIAAGLLTGVMGLRGTLRIIREMVLIFASSRGTPGLPGMGRVMCREEGRCRPQTSVLDGGQVLLCPLGDLLKHRDQRSSTARQLIGDGHRRAFPAADHAG
jgi:hypothetical protein